MAPVPLYSLPPMATLRSASNASSQVVAKLARAGMELLSNDRVLKAELLPCLLLEYEYDVTDTGTIVKYTAHCFCTLQYFP